MLSMILKMSAVTAIYVVLTVLIWKFTRKRRITLPIKLGIGVIYGFGAILSTHFGIDYSDMLLNVRDLGPLSAGLFFNPLSGILAGLIGGIERFIVGTYFGVGSYTRIACSVSTCLAGFVAAGMHIVLFKRKKPSAMYAFFMGAVMEVFHMYVVLITHRNDMSMAFYVVKTCSPPMIIFTGLGMVASSIALKVCAGEWKNPFRKRKEEEIPVSRKFQSWLFIVTFMILALNLTFSLRLQSRTAEQNTATMLATSSDDIQKTYNELKQLEGSDSSDDDMAEPKLLFRAKYFGYDSFCRYEKWNNGLTIMVTLPAKEVYANRDAQTYESVFEAIILFAVIYVLVSMLVQSIVVNNLELVNESLGRITEGNLNEVVSVRNSSEFASLSDDINQTVEVLKGYIDAAEKRSEQELEFARTIQESALPKNFKFPRDDFEIYATMDPAKEVGGDFYDFFFIDQNKLALVIADVSGKGIPAALFMMRSKTAIRGLAESGHSAAEILSRANSTLCEGNDAEMFVTVWIGIIDLTTGRMQCANAGHEYPLLMHNGGDYEYVHDKHGLALAAMDGMPYKEYELEMHPGDRLFVYTDGIPEAIDGNVEQYGIERLANALNTLKDATIADTLPAVRKNISDFVGEADQFDDITMLGFVYKGTAE